MWLVAFLISVAIVAGCFALLVWPKAWER